MNPCFDLFFFNTLFLLYLLPLARFKYNK